MQPALECGGALLRDEVVEHLAGGDEACSGAADDGLVEEVLGDHRLADAVGSEQDDVGGGVDPGEREEVSDLLAVELFRPAVVEIDDGLEAAELTRMDPALETALLAAGLFAGQQLLDPGLIGDRRPVAEQAIEAELLGALPASISGWCRRHHRTPRSGCRSCPGRAVGQRDRAGGGHRRAATAAGWAADLAGCARESAARSADAASPCPGLRLWHGRARRRRRGRAAAAGRRWRCRASRRAARAR